MLWYIAHTPPSTNETSTPTTMEMHFICISLYCNLSKDWLHTMIETCYKEVQRKPRLVSRVCASLPWEPAALSHGCRSLFLLYPSLFNLSLCVYLSHSLPVTHKLPFPLPLIKQERGINGNNPPDVCRSAGPFSMYASTSLYKRDKPMRFKTLKDGGKSWTK